MTDDRGERQCAGRNDRLTHHAGSGDIEGDGIIGGKVCDIELLYQNLLWV